MATVIKRRSKSDIVSAVNQHLVLKAEAAQITSRSEKLKKVVKDFLAEHFDYTNERGSKFLELPETVRAGGKSFRGVELRKSVPTPLFDEEKAEPILTQLGLLKQAQSAYIDQDKVLVLVQKGKITEEQLDSMLTTPEPTWSFWPVEGEVE